MNFSVMGNWRFFQVDPKSFEISREANPLGLSIIERGRNHMINVLFRKEGARWFQASMKDVASLQPDHQYLKTLREGKKVFLIQNQRNDRGRYISISIVNYEHKESSSKGRALLLTHEC